MKKILISFLFIFTLIACNKKVTQPSSYEISEDLPNGGDVVAPEEGEDGVKFYEIHTIQAKVDGTNSTVWHVKEGDIEFLEKIWGAILTNNLHTYVPTLPTETANTMALAYAPDWESYYDQGKVKSVLRGEKYGAGKSFYSKSSLNTLEREYKGVKIVAIPNNYGGNLAGKYTVAGIYTVKEQFSSINGERTQNREYDEGLILRPDIKQEMSGNNYYGAQFIWKPDTTINVSTSSDITFSDYTKSAIRSSYYFRIER